MLNIIDNTIAIILVAPQLGENIGAIARAMKNFGLKDLRIVMPRDGWPNKKAEITSVGAIDILKNHTKIFSSIESAISDLSLIFVTSSKVRNLNKHHVLSQDIGKYIDNNHSIGIIFGRESYGLNNREISFGNKIIIIETDRNFISLNIAHAVSIICYELFKIKYCERKTNLNNYLNLASQSELNHFLNRLFLQIEEKNFFRIPEKKIHIINKLRNLFSRIDNLSQSEVQLLNGVIHVLTKQESN